ncbi:MAG: hotdog domain-containing protein [Eubacteriaceae bacterium]|nr:hotdog domain-containing protein [Eubacteriaceae bacterium]
MKTYKSTHMVRYEDLNHHKNLYAGRAIEWMIESSFISASLAYGDGEGLLYKNTHKFDFTRSVLPGEIISFASTVVRAGTTSLTMHVHLIDETTGEKKAEAFTTFVTVEPGTNRSVKHGMVLDETDDEEEIKWRKEAGGFFK